MAVVTIVMIIVDVIVCVPVAVTVVPRPYGDAMDRAADAAHGAECARRRGSVILTKLLISRLSASTNATWPAARRLTGSVSPTIASPPPMASGWLLPVPGNGCSGIVRSLVTGWVVRSMATTSSLRGEVPNPSVPSRVMLRLCQLAAPRVPRSTLACRSEEHTSELQSLAYLVCRLLLEKKKKNIIAYSQV